jgi:hypothetical protein
LISELRGSIYSTMKPVFILLRELLVESSERDRQKFKRLYGAILLVEYNKTYWEHDKTETELLETEQRRMRDIFNRRGSGEVIREVRTRTRF